MVWVVHGVAGSIPTTFSAATDTLSQLEGGFEGGSKVWLHLPAVHLVMGGLTLLFSSQERAGGFCCDMEKFTAGEAASGTTIID